MKENKTKYLTPTVKVVTFTVESGYQMTQKGTKFETINPSNRNQAYEVQSGEESQWTPFQ